MSVNVIEVKINLICQPTPAPSFHAVFLWGVPETLPTKYLVGSC